MDDIFARIDQFLCHLDKLTRSVKLKVGYAKYDQAKKYTLIAFGVALFLFWVVSHSVLTMALVLVTGLAIAYFALCAIDGLIPDQQGPSGPAASGNTDDNQSAA